MKWYLILVLISVSLVPNQMSIFLCFEWLIFLVRYTFRTFAQFSAKKLLCILTDRFLCISYTRIPPNLYRTVKVSVTQSCPALHDPWTVAHQAPLSLGFSRQEHWRELAFPSHLRTLQVYFFQLVNFPLIVCGVQNFSMLLIFKNF